MLVTFQCKGYSSIPMFHDVAIQLLHLMQHSGTVPGAFAVEDVAPALQALKTAIENKPLQSSSDKISLRQRAIPLIGLLEHAVREQVVVMWR